MHPGVTLSHVVSSLVSSAGDLAVRGFFARRLKDRSRGQSPSKSLGSRYRNVLDIRPTIRLPQESDREPDAGSPMEG
jgi:hypothetical protein